MKLVPFVAQDTNAALAQIHEQLGPDAVVVSVRQLPAYGISRLWHHSGNIEVVACVAEETPAANPTPCHPAKMSMCRFTTRSSSTRHPLLPRGAGGALPGWNHWVFYPRSPINWNTKYARYAAKNHPPCR